MSAPRVSAHAHEDGRVRRRRRGVGNLGSAGSAGNAQSKASAACSDLRRRVEAANVVDVGVLGGAAAPIREERHPHPRAVGRACSIVGGFMACGMVVVGRSMRCGIVGGSMPGGTADVGRRSPGGTVVVRRWQAEPVRAAVLVLLVVASRLRDTERRARHGPSAASTTAAAVAAPVVMVMAWRLADGSGRAAGLLPRTAAQRRSSTWT